MTTFEGDKLFEAVRGKTSAFPVIRLQGTFHQMGRKYELLKRRQIKEYYDLAVDGYLIAKKGITYEEGRGATIAGRGATFPNDSPCQTYYQIVAVPHDLVLWVKSRGYSNWQKSEPE